MGVSNHKGRRPGAPRGRPGGDEDGPKRSARRQPLVRRQCINDVEEPPGRARGRPPAEQYTSAEGGESRPGRHPKAYAPAPRCPAGRRSHLYRAAICDPPHVDYSIDHASGPAASASSATASSADDGREDPDEVVSSGLCGLMKRRLVMQLQAYMPAAFAFSYARSQTGRSQAAQYRPDLIPADTAIHQPQEHPVSKLASAQGTCRTILEGTCDRSPTMHATRTSGGEMHPQCHG